MKISFRLDQLDSHAHFAVFVNGGKAGDLCLTAKEWDEFRTIFDRSSALFALIDNRPSKPTRSVL